MKNPTTTTRRRIPAAAFLIAAGVALSGCGTRHQEAPVGIGGTPNSLKQSPCACVVLPNAGRPAGFNAEAA